MDATYLKNPDLTLDEKLAAIDKMMESYVATANTTSSAPIDPADLTMCLGCQ